VFLYLPLFPHSIYSVVKRSQPKWTDHKRVAGRLAVWFAGFELVAHLNGTTFRPTICEVAQIGGSKAGKLEGCWRPKVLNS